MLACVFLKPLAMARHAHRPNDLMTTLSSGWLTQLAQRFECRNAKYEWCQQSPVRDLFNCCRRCGRVVLSTNFEQAVPHNTL